LGAWLSICAATALAQVSTQRSPEPAMSLPPGRDPGLTQTALYEVSAERSRVLGRPVALPQLGGRTSNDLAAVTYRVWRSHGRADFGVGVGTRGYLVPAAVDRGGAEAGQALIGAIPTVSMGLRIHVTDEHALFADAYRARGPVAGAAYAGYGTKLGVEWRPAKATLGLEHGALGMQLESGYRLSLKLRHGGPSLYLRSKF
jgi:hypothetical protein